MIRPRLIPILLIDNGNLIKTVQFKKYVYLGDPINAVKIFNEKKVDELCVMDRSAYKNGINFKLLKELAEEAFMPMSYGGGIKTLEDAIKVISIGFEKIIINQQAYLSDELISDISNEIGRQSVVVSIDYKKTLLNKRVCYYQQAKIKTKIDPMEHAIKAVKSGAGEIIITSIDMEGTMQGFDYDFIISLSSRVKVPIIAHGGAGNLAHVCKVIHDCGASAAAIGSLFVFFGKKKGILINYPDIETLVSEGVYRYD